MQLSELSNEMLLEEIQNRFAQRDAIIADSKSMMKSLEEMNKKLTKSEENRSKFMSIIKNEFNNPIFSMISLSKSLIKSSKDEKVQFIGESLYEESLMLNFQIKNIITAAEIESGTIDIQSSKVCFSDVLLQIKEELQYPILHKKITINSNIQSADDIYLDREKVYLIMLNLLSNAIEFSGLDSKVNVEISKKDEGVEIVVEDFGEGISEDEKENIFKRFYQAHSGMNRIHRGQGLGLSVVADLVQLLDGKVTYESTYGHGTRFWITLPKLEQDGCGLFDEDDFLFASDENFTEF